jgi:hypothetical protein
VQAAVAAGLAWFLATEVLDQTRPFFAPAAALIALALSGGQRGRRAFEIAAGVTVGIAVADAIVFLVGSGPLQLTAIVLLAMAAAVLLGGGVLAVTQAGVSAAFVVTLEQPDGFAFDRTFHAAIGSACALFVSFVVLPLDPLRLVRRAAGPVLTELAATLEDIAAALDAGDVEAAKAALVRARSADPLARDFADALVTGRETAVAALPRRRALRTIDVYTHAGAHLDLAVRNVRVLARGAVRALEVGDHVPPGATASLRELAAAVRALEDWLHDQGSATASRDHAVAAAREASAVLEQTANLSVSVIVGAVRSAAVDLLRSMGMEREEAVRLVRGEAVPA